MQLFMFHQQSFNWEHLGANIALQSDGHVPAQFALSIHTALPESMELLEPCSAVGTDQLTDGIRYGNLNEVELF